MIRSKILLHHLEEKGKVELCKSKISNGICPIIFQPPGETFGYIQVWFFAMPMDLAGIFTLGVANRGVINWEGTSLNMEIPA